MNFTLVSLNDLEQNFGDDFAKDILSDFSCPQNSEIENFISNSALDFSKRKTTITHIIFSDENEFVAFFSLTHKPLLIKNADYSSKIKRILKVYTAYNSENDSYEASGFLLAQFSKNFNFKKLSEISGNEMMDEVFRIILEVQKKIGGRILYLECDKSKEKLMNFYTNEHNKFVKFGERFDSKENVTYNQLFRVI